MATLEGICPKCGLHYTGRVLANSQKQKCDECGTRLKIYRDGKLINKKDSTQFEATEDRVDSSQRREPHANLPGSSDRDFDIKLYLN